MASSNKNMYFKATSFRWWLLVITANVLLTAWTVYARPTLDHDAILYINAAKAIADNDWALSVELYKGSFYPYLIYISKSVTGLNYEAASHLLNALFFSITSVAFISIVKLLGGTNNRVLVISFVLILFFPSILKYRPDIFREFGFLCCYFWSIFCLLKFDQNNEKLYLFIWALLLSIGTFLRIESLIILLCMGCFIFLPMLYGKAKKINKATFLKLILLILISLLLIYQVFPTEKNSLLSVINYPATYIKKALQVLNNRLMIESGGFTGAATTVITSIGDVFYILLKRLEVIYALLAVVAYKMQLVLRDQYQRKVITFYLSSCFIVLILFEMSLGYLTSRYAITFVMTVLLLIPFVIDKATSILFEGKAQQKLCVAILFIVLSFLSIKRLGISEHNVELIAGKWLSNNISHETVLVSNNSKILYYAERFPYLSFIGRGRHSRFNTETLISKRNNEKFISAEYIALIVRPKREIDLSTEKQFTENYGNPVKQFQQSDRSSYVNVYKTNN